MAEESFAKLWDLVLNPEACEDTKLIFTLCYTKRCHLEMTRHLEILTTSSAGLELLLRQIRFHYHHLDTAQPHELSYAMPIHIRAIRADTQFYDDWARYVRFWKVLINHHSALIKM